MTIDSLARRLSVLLKDGHLPAGTLGARHLERMRALFDAGVLEYRRAGAGRRVVIKNLEALEAFVDRLYPEGLGEIKDTGAPPRSKAVAHFRDAKRAMHSDAEPVLLRGFGDAVLRSQDGELPVAVLTRLAGVAALSLTDDTTWRFKGCVAVVENQEVFLHMEGPDLSCDLLLYAGGRISGRVLRWLGSPAMRECRYIHCGDYDPVGLDEYLRLVAACPGRVQLYMPSDLERHFIRHGKRELIKDSQGILSRLRKNRDPVVKKVVDLIDRHGVGVEQEILLIDK